jgi:hypothetical protein
MSGNAHRAAVGHFPCYVGCQVWAAFVAFILLSFYLLLGLSVSALHGLLPSLRQRSSCYPYLTACQYTMV